jgi:hypothetical protein
MKAGGKFNIEPLDYSGQQRLLQRVTRFSVRGVMVLDIRTSAFGMGS